MISAIYERVFDAVTDFLAIPIYIENYHFTVGGVLELMLFILIIAVILRVLLGRV